MSRAGSVPRSSSASISSAPQRPQQRTRAVDLRNAPKAVSQEVDRYMELDKRITVAKLQDRIARESSEARGASAKHARLPPGNDGTKYPVALPIDLDREREYAQLREDICDDPAGVPLDRMIARTMERKDQRVALEKRLQPSMVTIGSQKKPWEFQLMLAQRHSDDGDFLHDDFFAVLDSKAAVSDALHRHHSTAEMRAAVTHTFDDWVEDVQQQQPAVNEEVANRLQDMQRDVGIVTESQRAVDEAMMNMGNSMDQLHNVRMTVQDMSQRVAWAENNRLLAKQSSHKLFSRTRHVATLTDLTFRTDLLDPTDGEDDEDDDEGGGEFHVDDAADAETTYDGRSTVGSRAHSSVAAGRGRRLGGMRGVNGGTDSGHSVVTDDEHNRQLAALEKKLRQRYEAMMKMLKTAVAERRLHNDQEIHLKRLVELRDSEIVRLRTLYKGLMENRAFTALWDIAREDVAMAIPLTPGVADAAHKLQEEASGVEDVLRRLVEEVLAEARRDGVLSSSSRVASPVQQQHDGTFGIVLEEEGQEGAEVYRELNDLKRDHAALKETVDALHAEGHHREEMYQRLNQRFATLTQDHVSNEQLLAATEEDRASKTARLIESEKAVRDLSSKVAGFERLKAEELAQQQLAFDAEKALLERRAADLEKDLQAIINKYEKNNGNSDDADESPEIKFRKSNAKVQELETQVRTLKGLNGALDNNAKTLQLEVQQLIQIAIGFVMPLGEHLAAARGHLLGATALRGMEATRVCVWSDLDALLSHCRNGFLTGIIRHSSDPVFPEVLQVLNQLLTVSLTEMEEDKGTKSLEKELHKMTQLNRELKVQLKRAEGDLSHLRSNKTQVVDSIRAAATRIAEEAEAAAGDTIDIEDIPLASDDDDVSNDDGEEEDGSAALTGSASAAASSIRLARTVNTDIGDSAAASSRSGMFGGFSRSFRRASNVADGMRKRASILMHQEASTNVDAASSSSPPPASFLFPSDSDDPSPEGAFGPTVAVVNTAPNAADSGRRRSNATLLLSSRRRSTQQLPTTPSETSQQQRDYHEGANRGTPQSPPSSSSLRPNLPNVSFGAADEHSPSPHRTGSISMRGAVALTDSAVPQPSRSAASSLRRSSMRTNSPSVAPLTNASLARDRSGSSSALISTIYQDEGTQQVLEAAFANMRHRMDNALEQRDAAMSKAAAMARDLQEQSVRMADTGAAVLDDVVTKARHACFAMREMSAAYAKTVLGNIDANRSRIWVPADAEPLLVDARQTLPRQGLALVRAIVRKTCLFHVRRVNYQRMLDDMFAAAKDLGDVMTTGLWRRRMLHMEQCHATGLMALLSDLADVHQRRLAVLQRLEVLIELPRAGRGAAAGSDKSKTPPPPLPLSSHTTPRDASAYGSSVPQCELEDVRPPIESCDASCATSGGGPFVLGSIVPATVQLLIGAISQFCAAGGAGLQTAALGALTSFTTNELWEGRVLTRGVGGACGIADHDDWVTAQTTTLEAQLCALGEQLAAYQSRVESEAYLRFITPAAGAVDETANDAGALDDMLKALDDVDEGDGDAADQAVENEQAAREAAEERERMRSANTAAAVESLDAAWTKRYQQLDDKHKQMEGTLKDTKVQLRKALKSITSDKFAHIETRPWVLTDVIRMNRGRILQALAHAAATDAGSASDGQTCPCPVCGKIIVTSPQKPFGRHPGGPTRSSVCTETILLGDDLLPSVGLLADEDDVAWSDPVSVSAGIGAQRATHIRGRTLPSSTVGAAADAHFMMPPSNTAHAHHTTSGGGQGLVISPLLWNLGPLPTRPTAEMGHDNVSSVALSPALGVEEIDESIPLLRFTPHVGGSARGAPHYALPPTVASSSTQTDADLIAPLLMNMLDRLPQAAAGPHAMLRRAEGMEVIDPAPSNVSSATGSINGGTGGTGGVATMAHVRDRLWKFSTERRASIAMEITKDNSFELLGEGLQPQRKPVDERVVQSRVVQAVLGRRALSPQSTTLNHSDAATNIGTLSMLTVPAHLDESECTLVITSGGHQHPASSLTTLSLDKEHPPSMPATNNSTFRATLSSALQRSGGSAHQHQRSADVLRRLPGASLAPAASRNPPLQESTATVFGVVGQRPPSAGAAIATGGGSMPRVASASAAQRVHHSIRSNNFKSTAPTISSTSGNTSPHSTDDPSSEFVAPPAAYLQRAGSLPPTSSTSVSPTSSAPHFPTDVVHIPTSRPSSGSGAARVAR